MVLKFGGLMKNGIKTLSKKYTYDTMSTYESTMSTYESTMSTYESTMSTYESTMSTYESTMSTYESTMSTYQLSYVYIVPRYVVLGENLKK